MKRFRAYLPFALNTFQRMLAYRANVIIFMVGELAILVVSFFLWRAVFQSSPEQVLQGFSMQEMYLYIFITFLTGLMTSVDISFDIAREVKDGTIAINLIRPISYEKRMLFQALGGVLYNFVVIFLGAFILANSIHYGTTGTLLLGNGPLYALSMLLGLLINFYFSYTFGLLAFKVTNMWGVSQIMGAISQLLSGALIPLVFFPGIFRSIVEKLPFGSMIYTPTMIYVLYSFSQGTYLLGLLPSVFFIYDQQREGIILWGIVAGMAVLLSFWRKDQELQWRKEYQLRKRLYEQEEMETLLLHEQKHLENMSRLKERQRIAEVLHDELGHELTAAHLSLKAARTVAKEEEGLLVNTLDKSLHRLEAGLTKLKEAVRQIEPTKESFLDTVETLKKECTYPVTFTHEGDLRRLEPYQEQLVFGMIKEGFTNIEKHANPSEVEIHVAILETVLRVRLYNDGVKEEKSMTGGNGLRYLRKRLEAVGGTVSSQKEKGAFTLLMVLPLRGGNEDD